MGRIQHCIILYCFFAEVLLKKLVFWVSAGFQTRLSIPAETRSTSFKNSTSQTHELFMSNDPISLHQLGQVHV